ncbi:MAG: CvpA family protein, partial [Actinomycetota bacterium]
MNALDLLLLVLVALSGVAGYRRGFTLQAFGFGGLLIGLVAGALLAPFIGGVVDGPNARAGIAVLTLL